MRRENSYGSTVLRLGLGAVALAHGLAKIFVFTIGGTIGFFESVGFPGLLAIPVMVLEIGGGALLVAGVFTRWAALAMIPIVLGATSVHWPNGWMFTNPGGGWEYTGFLALAFLSLFLHGDDGRLSVAERLRTRRARPVAQGRRAAAGSTA